MQNMNKIKLALVATVPSFFVHLINNIQKYQQGDFEVTLITSKHEYSAYLRENYGFNIIEIEIARDISLFKDLESIWNLFIHFKKKKYDIVHSATPKAGLVVAIAGFLARTPVRIHTFTGQVWANLNGPLRWIQKKIDQFIILINTRTYADSPSQIQYLIDEGVTKVGRVHCLNLGSLGGIEPKKFQLSNIDELRYSLAKQLEIPESAKRILFVGRITPDKGIHELVEAFLIVAITTDAYLLLVGTAERLISKKDQELYQTITNHPRIRSLGFQKNPAFYMMTSDFLCLPSYREGFGTVVIEAAAAGICALGTDIPGLRDAISDKRTGLLVPARNTAELANAMKLLCDDNNLRGTLSRQAQLRATTEFNFNIISDLQMAEYNYLLNML